MILIRQDRNIINSTPAQPGFTRTLKLSGAQCRVTLSPDANGDFIIPPDTLCVGPVNYSIIDVEIADTTNVKTVKEGVLTVRDSLGVASIKASHGCQMVDAINEVLLKDTLDGVQSYSTLARQVSRYSPLELKELLVHFTAICDRDKRAEAGLSTFKTVQIRFS